MENQILTGIEFIYLMLIICIVLLIGWIWFFQVVKNNNESVRELLIESSFIQNLTIILVVATSGILGVMGILKGELVSTLLGSIVGYVLGTTKKSNSPK